MLIFFFVTKGTL